MSEREEIWKREAENIDFYDWFMASRVWSGWKGNWVRKLPSWRHFPPSRVECIMLLYFLLLCSKCWVWMFRVGEIYCCLPVGSNIESQRETDRRFTVSYDSYSQIFRIEMRKTFLSLSHSSFLLSVTLSRTKNIYFCEICEWLNYCLELEVTVEFVKKFQ
jgi:hypothetical protein